jgi:predicted GIY-YIG superfamily endonuclease
MNYEAKYYLYQLETVPKYVFYIGITDKPSARLKSHLRSRKRATLKERFIDDARITNTPIKMTILAVFPDYRSAYKIEWGMLGKMYGLLNGKGNVLMDAVYRHCDCEWTDNMSQRKSDLVSRWK